MAKKVGKSSSIRPYMMKDLTGGMNVSESPEFIADNECVTIRNMEFDVQGNKLRTRRGLGSPLARFESNIVYVYNDYEVNDFFVFTADKKVYRYEFGKNPILIGKINGESARPSCCKFDGKVIIASGSKLQVYDYNSLSEIENSPNADLVFERFGRVVCTKAGQDNLYYSGIGDLNQWEDNSNDDASSKSVNIGYKDGGDILGATQLASDIMVFKSNGVIYDVQNEPVDWNILKIGDNSDFLSRHACLNLNNDVVFLSSLGLRSVATSMSYSNFEKKEIGEKCNPDIMQRVDKPFLSHLRRSKQLLISGASRNHIYVYHYRLKAFTLWEFPWSVTSVCENRNHVLVAMNKHSTHGALYELSFDNERDEYLKIQQEIKSKELRDTHDMIVYRTYIDIQSKKEGEGTIFINSVEIPYNWSNDEQQKEFKTQIIAPRLQFKFTTDDVIIFKYVNFDIVMSRESMVSEKEAKGGIGGIRKRSSSRRRSKHDDFLKGVKKKGASPYG